MPGYERTPFFGFQSIFKEQPPIAAFVSTDTIQSIPGSTPTQITFATPLVYDPLNTKAYQSVWDASTPGQFTIRVRGWYLFGASVVFQPATAQRIGISLARSGVGAYLAFQEVQRTGAADNVLVSVTTLCPCPAGETLQVIAYQTSGGAVNTSIFGDMPNMWIVRVG